MERLEARILMSAASGGQPSVAVDFDWDQFVAGQPSHLTVDLANTGEAAAVGSGTLNVYLVPSGADQGAPDKAYLIGSFRETLNIGVMDAEFSPGQQVMGLNLLVPAADAGNSYTLYVGLDAACANADSADNFQFCPVIPDVPLLDIAVDPFTNIAIDGRRVTGQVILDNNGNYSDVGPVNISVYAVPVYGGDDQKILIESFSKDIAFGDTYTAQFDLNTSLPAEVNNGLFRLQVVAVANNGQDANPDDNASSDDTRYALGGYVDIGVTNTNLWIEAGGGLSGRIDLSSYGNISNVGRVDFTIFAVPAGGGDSQRIKIASFSQDIAFDGSGSAAADVPDGASLPSALGDGEYTLEVVAAPRSHADIDPADNTYSDCTPCYLGNCLDIGISDVAGSLGQDGSGQVSFWLLNNGTVSKIGTVEFTVYLSADGTVDDHAVRVATFQQEVDSTSEDGCWIEISHAFRADPSLASGDYLVVVATPADGTDLNPSDNTAASYDPIAASEPQWTDWRAYMQFIGAPRYDIGVCVWSGPAPGGNGTAQAYVMNYGWQADTGNVQYSLYLSSDGQIDDSSVLLASVTRRDSITWDGLDLDLNYQIPSGMADGDYQLILLATPLDCQDACPDDNVGVSSVIVGTQVSVETCDITAGDGLSGSIGVTGRNSGTRDVGAVRYDVYVTPAPTADCAWNRAASWQEGACWLTCSGSATIWLTWPDWGSFLGNCLIPTGSSPSDATLVGSVERDGGIASGESDSFSMDFTLPQGLVDGTYQVLVQATPLDGQNVDPSQSISWSWQTIMLQTADNGSGPVQVMTVSGRVVWAICCTDAFVLIDACWTDGPVLTFCCGDSMQSGAADLSASLSLEPIAAADAQLADDAQINAGGQLTDDAQAAADTQDGSSGEAPADILNDGLPDVLPDALSATDAMLRVI